MLKIGLTGGIGAGKSVVAKIFESLGVPIFNSDSVAKWLMVNDLSVKKQIIDLLGNVYLEDGSLNRALIAKIIFNDPHKKRALESIVHPAVENYFVNWTKEQSSAYVIRESAILFETGKYKDLDYIITVYSPKELRIKRTIERSGLTESQVMERIKNQLDDKLKIQKSDFLILNDEQNSLIVQVLNLHNFFLKQSLY